jgi:hypothetical protein
MDHIEEVQILSVVSEALWKIQHRYRGIVAVSNSGCV